MITETYENGVMSLSEDGNGNFCIILSKNGAEPQYSHRIEDFPHLIEQASLGWLDFSFGEYPDITEFAKKTIETASTFGFSNMMVNRLFRNNSDNSRLRGAFEDINTQVGILLPVIQLNENNVEMEPLVVLINDKFILTFHNSKVNPISRMRRYSDTYLSRLPQNLKQNDWMTILLARLIDMTNQHNFMLLQQIEEYSDFLSCELSETRYLPPELSHRIYREKHKLIKYISGLWITADILSYLRGGDVNLLSDNPQILNRIARLASEVNGQIGVAEHISEVLASGLECLQSIYNNRLQILNNRLSIVNNRITLLVGWLTVVGTALLVPNTIATVVSQTNVFTFGPGDMWWYLILIIGSTIVATFLAWYWVKQKGLMPKKGGEEESGPIAAAEREREEVKTPK